MSTSALTLSSSTAVNMPSSDLSHITSFVLLLANGNFQKWSWAVKVYLTPNNHVCVIKCTKYSTGKLHDPVAPTNAKELVSWNQSEWMAVGIIAGLVMDLHLELLHRYEDKGAWPLWCTIEALHEQKDASLHHGAWMGLLRVHQGEDEGYGKFLRCITDMHAHVDRITPTDLSTEECMDKLILFMALSGMCPNDLLQQLLLTHRTLTLSDLSAVFLHTNQNSTLSSAVEAANAATILHCFLCTLMGHITKNCPHAKVFACQLAQHTNNNGKGKGKGKGKGQGNVAATSGTSNQNTSNLSSSATGSHDSTGVASTFLSAVSHATDGWILDSGTTCCMSSNCLLFSTLWLDHHQIHLADGKAIYLRGMGSIQFLSECGFYITIHNVLFIPLLTVNLFKSNKFARQEHNSYSKVINFPLWQWINWATGTTEFMATIHANNLMYVNWKPAPSGEHANVTLSELHSQLNLLPISVVKSMLQERPVVGLLDHVTGMSSADICEDCVNRKLTCVAHTMPVACVPCLLYQVFSDVHGPLPVHSRCGHVYWVTFINNFSQFPAVYFITKKSDIFAAFHKYKAWVENLTSKHISILCDDKGGKYRGTNLDKFLTEAGICHEHSICDTPQQLGMVEQMNHSLSKGITVLLSQSGLVQTWWEDVAMHWLYGKICIPSSSTKPLTPFKLFYRRKPDVSLM